MTPPYARRTPRQISTLIAVRLREIVAICSQLPDQRPYYLPDFFERPAARDIPLPAKVTDIGADDVGRLAHDRNLIGEHRHDQQAEASIVGG